ncbi:MAG: glycosyltransferase 87 family protein [Candidatus Acidiferrales bacterium]
MLTNGSVHARRTPSQVITALLGGFLLELSFFLMRRLGNLELYVVEFITAALAAGIVYFICVYLFEHARDSRAGLWLILAAAVLFRVTLLSLAPTLSEDLYRYRWDGRIQLAGWNPYALRPDDPRLRSLHKPRESHFPGSDIPSIYPPLAELSFRAAARLLPSPRAFKLPIAAADLAVLFLLAAWLRRTGGRNYQLAVYAWNPLVVVEFAGSGHSEALTLAALVAAYVIIRSRPTLSTLGLAAAALLKSFPVMLFPAWLRRNGWPASRRSWGDTFAAAALAAACFWPYRSALGQIHQTMSYYESRWQNNNASLYAILAAFSGSHELAAGIGVGVAVGLALWAAWRKMDPTRAAYLIIGAILMFTPNAYSWYFTWIIPFLCFFPNPAWLLLTILQFLSYEVLINYQAFGQFQFNPKYVFLTYAPFYALLLGEFFSRKTLPPIHR